MSRFDLYPGTGTVDYYLDVQADHMDFLDSRIVLPVVSASKMSIPNPRLHVPLTINGALYYTVTNMMGAVSPRTLGKAAGTAQDQSYAITGAIDFLLQGF